MNRYTPMRITCDLCEASFNEAMATMDVPIYLHVHPLLLERAQSIANARDMTPSPFVVGEPKRVIALADESITNVNEWYLETSIGSNPDETYNEAKERIAVDILNRAFSGAYPPGGDGVALTSMAHPEGLIEKMAEAIKDGRLSLTKKQS